MRIKTQYLKNAIKSAGSAKERKDDRRNTHSGSKLSVFQALVILIAAICFAVLAVKEYRPFRQLSGISFENMAKKRIESSADTLSAFFSLSDVLTDSLKSSLPLLTKDYKTELPRPLRTQIEESSVQGVFVYLEDKDIGKRSVYADSVRLAVREDSIRNPANYRSRRDAWQPDSGWAAYLPKGARTFAVPERQNVRTYYGWFKKADSAGIEKEWLGPVFDDGSKSRVIYRISPVEIGAQRGFILIAHSVNRLYAYMQGIGISRYGSPYIIDTSGNFIVNATNEVRPLSELGKAFRDSVFLQLSEDVRGGNINRNGYFHRNRLLGQSCAEFVFAIPEMPFYLGASVYSGNSQESGAYQSVMRRISFRILAFSVISILLCLFGLKILFKPATTGTYVLIPVCLLLSIIICVTVFYRYPGSSSGGRTAASDYEELPYSESDKKILKENGVDSKWNPMLVIDQRAVDFFVTRYQNRSDSLYGSQAKILPTGVMINSILFSKPNVVQANGFVWQKFLITGEQYPRQFSRKYLYDTYRNKGVDFFGGQYSGSYGGSFELTDSLETTMEGYKAVLMRWSFVVETEQVPSYGLYPFGIYNMSFTVKGKNRDDNTMLVPDMTAYGSMFPIDKPGIDNRLNITGWDILQSSYSYRFNRNSSNLGNVNSQNRAPDIRLNLSIATKFMDILVSKLLSVMVIVTLLFVLVFIRDKDNILDTVLGCSGLFFALVLDHVNLRERVQSTDVMYLEFIYLTVYGFLLLTILSAIYLKKTGAPKAVNLNLVMRNYFWSAFFGVMAAATMWRFY
ncbi:MAG: hypothetical protein LBB56_01895 [Chitinispirillales bacterium]|jgi:hypothetical protein|nr:hypothetical protein [Chitinispirillales bacterium]